MLWVKISLNTLCWGFTRVGRDDPGIRMKVQVTKDYFGVQVWRPDVKLKFNLLKDDLGSWHADAFFSRRWRLLDTKQVNRWFPELNDMLKEGDRKMVELRVDEMTDIKGD